MTRRHRRRGTTPNPDLLQLPRAAAGAIVESGSIIACPVLGIGRFVDYCKARGPNIRPLASGATIPGGRSLCRIESSL